MLFAREHIEEHITPLPHALVALAVDGGRQAQPGQPAAAWRVGVVSGKRDKNTAPGSASTSTVRPDVLANEGSNTVFKWIMVLCIVVVLLAGCKNRTVETAGAEAEAAALPPGEPPVLDVGISVAQAYAAIPHRRTVWSESDSTVPAAQQAYLRAIFAVLDQGVAARVAGLEHYSAQQFDAAEPVENYDRLIAYVRGLAPPPALSTYQGKVLEALAAQRQFFADWKAAGDGFPYAQKIGEHAGARQASDALRAAYNELMAHYPNEGASNKDAFFDYHCALDFL